MRILRPVENTSHTPYREVMNKWGSSERLFAAAKAVRDLEDVVGWGVICDLIAEVRQKREDALIHGFSTDPAEVSRLRGQVDGLKSVQTAAEAILKAADDYEQKLNDEQSRQTAGAER